MLATVSGFEVTLGAAHEMTLACKDHLGSLLQRKGELRQAAKFLKEALGGIE